jgi:hypothetical protein
MQFMPSEREATQRWLIDIQHHIVMAQGFVGAKRECRRIFERTARARIEADETQRSVARSHNVNQTTISGLAA